MARLAFLGTPELAVPPLQALVDAGHDVILCVTRPDRRRGRGSETTPSPVSDAARALGIAVTHSMDDVAAATVELAVVVAYGRIIPKALLERVPMLNLHFSLLPRWRGAAPVERAILAGDTQTGVCVMRVEEGLDTGPIYARRVVPIDDDMDLETLRGQLVALGSQLLVETLAGGVSALGIPEPQVGEATIAQKISREDLHLNWEQSAEQLHRVVRLGRAWTTFRGHRLGVLTAHHRHDDIEGVPPGTLDGVTVATGSGALVLGRVQPESRSPMSAEEWIRGVRPSVGERLGSG